MLAFPESGVSMLNGLMILSRNGKEIGVDDRLLMRMAMVIVLMNRMMCKVGRKSDAANKSGRSTNLHKFDRRADIRNRCPLYNVPARKSLIRSLASVSAVDLALLALLT
jgi:hypothetical protein